ncbi:MAG: ROK family protein [Nakamurella sp.]
MTDGKRSSRRDHESRILRELRRAGTLGRADLVRRTSLPRSSVFAIVGELISSGVLIESTEAGSTERRRGRPSALISLDPATGLIVGVDIGRQSVRMVVANSAHQIVAAGAADPPAGPQTADSCAEVAEALIRRVADAEGIDLSALDAIGVGLFGLPGVHDSVASQSDALCHRLSSRFEVPVLSGNNSRLAALAEATWGAGRNVDDQVYVRWSVGVGGGYLVAGRPLLGAHGAAGELGHVSIDPDGPACECGGRGCLERSIGGQALIEQCRRRGLRVADLNALVDAVQARMAVAEDVVTGAASQLGVVVAGTVAQLDPQRVILGGELGQLGGPVVDAVQAEIDRLAVPKLRRTVEVVRADLGVNDGALGAVALVLRSRQLSSTG